MTGIQVSERRPPGRSWSGPAALCCRSVREISRRQSLTDPGAGLGDAGRRHQQPEDHHEEPPPTRSNAKPITMAKVATLSAK